VSWLTVRDLRGFRGMGAEPVAPVVAVPTGPPSLATALIRARQKLAMIRGRTGGGYDDEDDYGPAPARPLPAALPVAPAPAPPPPPPALSIGGGASGDLLKLLGVGVVAGGAVMLLSRAFGGGRR
jgi:hypothetical protein